MPEAITPSPQQTCRPYEPSIFFQVCESRWTTQSQISPHYVHGAIAAYMTYMNVVLQFIPVIVIVHTEQSDELLFYGSYLSFMLQVVCYWISFWHTLKDLEHPRNSDAIRRHSEPMFSVFNTILFNVPLIAMYTQFDRKSLFSGLAFLIGILAFQINVMLLSVGVIEVLVLSSRYMQQPTVFEILVVLVVCLLHFTWIVQRLLALGKPVFQAPSPGGEDWTIPFRIANCLLVVNSIMLVLQLYFQYVGNTLDSISEVDSPQEATLELAAVSDLSNKHQDGDGLDAWTV